MVDNSGLKLYVNCMDNNIYCYNLSTYSAEPLVRYVGLRNSTFYIKSSLSPDGQYLLSGSSDEKAYIWNINNPQPLVALVGHTVEVTCVAWSHSNEMRIVTCSDDARHKIWRIGPDTIEDDQLVNYRGRAEYCKEYKNNQLKVRLKALENTPRSIRRLVEQNETTPSSAEKIVNKRSYSEMCMNDLHCHEDGTGGSELKRPHIETKGRRLFSPSTSSSSVFNSRMSADTINSNLASILEESETPSPSTSFAHAKTPNLNKTTVTYFSNGHSTQTQLRQSSAKVLFSPPLSDKTIIKLKSPETPSPPSTAHQQRPGSSLLSAVVFSPTSNLPNFVVNGEAPHLQLQSPKRKLKENVDWLTKIRKQKLMSSINSQLNDKLNGYHNHQTNNTSHHHDNDYLNDICMSPRMQSLKASDCSPSSSSSSTTPKRRASRSGSHDTSSASHQRTPNSRRNSETTILRFFSIKSQKTATPVSSCVASTNNDGNSTSISSSSTSNSNNSNSANV